MSVDEVSAEDVRVRPLRILEGRRDDVLGHAVELVGELAVPLRPRCGEPLVGDTAEQERLGVERLLELELPALLALSDLERPTAVLEVLAPPGSSMTPSSDTNSVTTIRPMP